MTTIGLLQYFAPVLQFIVALVVFREAMTLDRWIGFGVVWLALLVLTVDMLAATRKSSAARRLARGKRERTLKPAVAARADTEAPSRGAPTVRSRSEVQDGIRGPSPRVVVPRHNHHRHRQGPQHLVGGAAR